MFRWLYRMFVALMTLGTLAVLGVGFTSYWRGVPTNAIWINTQTPERQYHVAMIDGVLHAVFAGPRDPDAPRPLDIEHEYGSFYAKRLHVGDVIATGAGAPFWALACVMVIWPASALISGPLRRWRRRRHGHCAKCGYDLHGLTEPRCPECGREFQLEAAPTAAAP